MISEALTQLATPYKGIGYKSITYYIDENYPVKKNFSRYVRHALNTGLESGIFQLAPIAKYRLSPKGRNALKKQPLKKLKKTATKKVATQSNPKKRKSPTSSSDSTPKKKPRSSSKKEKTKKSTLEKKKKQPKKRSDVLPKEKSKFSHIWQFKENNNLWGNYDLKASDQLEEVYLAYLENREGTDIRTVKSGQWEYEVDFKTLQQTNIQHPSRTVRSIRRVPISP